MDSSNRIALALVVAIAAAIASAAMVWQISRSAAGDRTNSEINYSRFMSEVDAGNVASVVIAGTRIEGQYRDGKGTFRLVGPSNPSVYLDALRNKGVEIRFQDARKGSSQPTLGSWMPLIVLGALWFFLVRQIKKRNSTRPPGMPPSAGNSSFPIEPS